VALGSGNRSKKNCSWISPRPRPDRVGVRNVYNDPLAHKIEARCDMFLMPSRNDMRA
jgi:glycogen synthase